MKKILILGAGSAGTMLVNHLRHLLDFKKYQITIVDRDNVHIYQPGLLYIPFGYYKKEDVLKSRSQFLPKGVEFLIHEIDRVLPQNNSVKMTSGVSIPYDVLVIASGSRIVPSETEGLEEGWRRNIFDFYTLDGSIALGKFLKTWQGGKLVVQVKEMPIKCPVAPLEFAFLADAFFRKKKMRDRVEISYVTPLPGAFTKPLASKKLETMMQTRQIKVFSEFDIERVDAAANKLTSFDGREVFYDLLVTVPTNMGDTLVERSGLGDELGFISTQVETLVSTAYPNIFVIGDATGIATSKAGSVAHFESEILAKNIKNYCEQKPLDPLFDGHANCFIESGNGKGVLIDFSIKVEPLPGTFPLPYVGPFSLLRETRINHWGKLAFKWIYWNLLLKGRSIPFVQNKFSMRGKIKE